ncbi:MAG TPA: EamA family transporter RarD [Bacteroidales bacterium]|nr:EamA family transporter RarD [Bacteroidales bacterium]HPT01569.1 EamA family transporter RarD [Bacteroidales bacterium]
MPDNRNSQYFSGLMLAVLCYTCWGIFPVYWKLLKEVPSDQILVHRIVWSFIFLGILLAFLRNRQVIRYLKDIRIAGLLLMTGLLVGSNWGVYIYAVNHDRIVDTSLGYYMNPMVNVLLGVIFLKERLSRIQKLAVLFAVGGIVWLTLYVGRLPWISVYLALSFGAYGLLRKKANLESLPAVFIETMLLTPLAIGYLLFAEYQGTGAFLHGSWLISVLLIIGGPVTALPLYWFGKAATKIPLSTIGFIQYLSPTIALLIGIFVYREPFRIPYVVAFAMVWTGLALYTISILRDYRTRRLS